MGGNRISLRWGLSEGLLQRFVLAFRQDRGKDASELVDHYEQQKINYNYSHNLFK